jgi:signal transduction histidine kinase
VALAIVSTIRRLRQSITARLNSLAARLILAAAIWLSLGLAVGAYVLSHAFSSAVADNFDTTLQVDLDGLIAAAEPDAYGVVNLEDRFLNRRFSRVYSGLYWQILPDAGNVAPQYSPSLFDFTIKVGDPVSRNGQFWGRTGGPDNQRLRVLARHVSFPVGKRSVGYTFYVAGDLAHVEYEIADFNDTLARSFAVLGVGLILAILIQVRIGLLPLKKAGEALARIRSGAARRLEGSFPAEIAPLAAELNSLIEHSAEVVGRARTHVSNLAHFFKTPLSVLASEADAAPGPLAEAVKRQVEAMRRQVDHYLARARAAGAMDVLGNRTEIAPVLEALVRALARIHQDRRIDICVECPADLAFRGERQDLEEMAGNLMDNACKWARSEVRVRVEAAEDPRFVLTVEDDGPGLSPADRGRVLQRGERLDESVPGSGLGLSIVRDIAKLYGGELAFAESRQKGLAARLTLPAIR